MPIDFGTALMNVGNVWANALPAQRERETKEKKLAFDQMMQQQAATRDQGQLDVQRDQEARLAANSLFNQTLALVNAGPSQPISEQQHARLDPTLAQGFFKELPQPQPMPTTLGLDNKPVEGTQTLPAVEGEKHFQFQPGESEKARIASLYETGKNTRMEDSQNFQAGLAGLRGEIQKDIAGMRIDAANARAADANMRWGMMPYTSFVTQPDGSVVPVTMPRGQVFGGGGGGTAPGGGGSQGPSPASSAPSPSNPASGPGQGGAFTPGIAPTADQKNKAAQLRQVIPLIDQLEKMSEGGYNSATGQMMEGVHNKEGIGARLSGLGRAGGAWLGTDPEAKVYENARKGFLAQIARLAGEVGVLTEGDTQRASELTSPLWANRSEAKGNFKLLRDLILARTNGVMGMNQPQGQAGATAPKRIRFDAQGNEIP